jgi:glucose/arabinose dehydrogenase
MSFKNLLCGLGLFLAAAGQANAQSIDTMRIANGITRPVEIAHAPGDDSRLFIVEKQGRIRIINLETNTLLSTPFLDINSIVGGGTSTGDERGLLGLAFHPNYAQNGYFFVYYTNNSSDTQISRYSVSSNLNVADSSSAKSIMNIDQPYSNHNGGCIKFDCNGYLLIGTGDGGSGNDPGNRSQDITNQLLGKILRIDIDTANGVPYAIPADNPFVGVTGDDEILHYGMRNPWKIYVDPETCDLYIGDVGQNAREEIDIVSGDLRGANFGWRCMEANGCTGLSGCTCNASSLTDPVYSYNQGSNGYSVTGGVVYRGCAIPDLQGTYFFADYGSTNIWSLRYSGGSYTGFLNRNELETASGGYGVDNISSFGTDANGEVYIADQSGGEIFKIIPSSGDVSCETYPNGDINEDCLVNGSDLAIVLGFWGSTTGGDLDGDGVTGGSDLAIVLGFWGATCE